MSPLSWRSLKQYHYVRCQPDQPLLLFSVVLLPPGASRQLRSRARVKSFRACCDNRLRSIHVAVAPLKFSFQFHLEPRQIDQVPVCKFPGAIVLRSFGFKSTNTMHSIIANFISGDCWLEIKRAETAIAAPGKVKLWVEIEHPAARNMDNAQIGIAGTLHVALGGAGEITIQSGRRIQKFAQTTFEMT